MAESVNRSSTFKLILPEMSLGKLRASATRQPTLGPPCRAPAATPRPRPNAGDADVTGRSAGCDSGRTRKLGPCGRAAACAGDASVGEPPAAGALHAWPRAKAQAAPAAGAVARPAACPSPRLRRGQRGQEHASSATEGARRRRCQHLTARCEPGCWTERARGASRSALLLCGGTVLVLVALVLLVLLVPLPLPFVLLVLLALVFLVLLVLVRDGLRLLPGVLGTSVALLRGVALKGRGRVRARPRAGGLVPVPLGGGESHAGAPAAPGPRECHMAPAAVEVVALGNGLRAAVAAEPATARAGLVEANRGPAPLQAPRHGQEGAG
mmetsp:Transcript_10831/g.36755  ORF Transcript_10831/g.36755 Transcript_10831/m.36755 type:complete len:325 (+) Transcript_10831:299-1273(+)